METTTYTIDLAAIIATLIWPIILLIVFFNKRFSALIEPLLSRITKVEFAGIALELPVAKSYLPDEGKSAETIEFWHKVPAVKVNDSYATTFFKQFNEGGSADYAVIDLETGESWLTSRLFILSILYPQIKGIKTLVFVETVNGIRKKYLGWANADKIRWMLAKAYPWFEQEFQEAYGYVLRNRAKVIAANGRLGDPSHPSDPSQLQASINLLREFLQRVQTPTLLPDHLTNEWVFLNSVPYAYEHAHWIKGELLEQIAGDNLQTTFVRSSELRAKSTKEKASLVAAMTGQFVAVTNDEYRFEYLIDRQLLLEQHAIQVLTA